MNPNIFLQELNQNIVACTKCKRFVDYRTVILAKKPRAYVQDLYWNKPVPGWGDPDASLLIVGLAPGAHGANRTGKVFVGDRSGEFLFQCLSKTEFAQQAENEFEETGWVLNNVFLTNAVRCAPPGNLPDQSERDNCRQYLKAELELLKNLEVILALGKIAFDEIIKILPKSYSSKHDLASQPKFKHGALYSYQHLQLVSSYHPSRRNTQTGLLTNQMLEDMLRRCKDYIENSSET